MTDLKMCDLGHVKVLAQEAANKEKKNQVIFSTYYGRNKGFRFLPQDKWDGKVVATVRYTPENNDRKVLRRDGDGEPATTDNKSTGKAKSGGTGKSKPKA